MLDSNVTVFPGRAFDPTNPLHVASFLGALPPAPPNRRALGSFCIVIDRKIVSFRVTRAALEAVAGSSEPSSPRIAIDHFDTIERHCRALHASGVVPIKGWVLDVDNLANI